MLNLASIRNSPDRSTKSTRSPLRLPQLVNTGFQVLFHSPPGVLFTFPSQYYALSVTEEYLALGGGPPDFPQGSTCLAVLRILPACLSLRIRGFHPVSHDFPEHFCWVWQYLMQSITPVCQADWFRLFPFRSPLLRESMFLSLPAATKMFQFTASTSC